MADDTNPRIEEGAPAAGDSAPSPESADRAAPSSTTSRPQGVESLDALLAEYDEGTKAPPEQPQQNNVAERNIISDPLAEQRLDSALSGIDREIEAKARGFYEQERHKAELAQAFEGHVAGIQAKLPEYIPESFARDSLIAMATSDPRLEVAFRAASMGVNRPQIMAELDRVNFAIQHASRNPTADPNVIPQLQQMAHELSIAFHAHTILRQAEAEIVKRANARPPIDPDLTADRAAVIASLKGASQPFDAKEPAPRFSTMGEAEFRNFTRSNYGF
jgi:hypothetical protein